MEGTTAHASTPWKGADAIAAMAEVVCGLRCAIQSAPSHEELGVSTVTFGQIEGGYRPYVVPDRCKLWVDLRLVPPTDRSRAAALLTGAIRRAAQAAPGGRGRCAARRRGAGEGKGWAMGDSNPRHQRCKRCALTN